MENLDRMDNGMAHQVFIDRYNTGLSARKQVQLVPNNILYVYCMDWSIFLRCQLDDDHHW